MKFTICIMDKGDPRFPSLLKNYTNITNMDYKPLGNGYTEISFEGDKVSEIDYYTIDMVREIHEYKHRNCKDE